MKLTDYIQLFLGIVIGLAAASLGVYLFLELFADNGFENSLSTMRTEGLLGKVITIGTVLNLIVFFILIRLKKDMMAWGIITATAILALITVIV
ncbi:hypothetical protein FUA48_06500 [Flavobacterium alkalisoli]|uniref:DUF3784 domain-containing protein n=1 Tax=Flavobacterium alkalisoli TaxID=2602769 RepID=A0A5B9FUB6_9FLAO|nr:hypothetical protein [Flavobacterium alkalisoli]QEE49238.1 hypothetical protein FUA48_06500 [Flavobacterium alkalisoli]